MSLKDDLRLDIMELDRAALDQASIYGQWGEEWAQAVDKRDKIKERISAAKAHADEQIRANPRDYGWDSSSKSPTETWIANQVFLHPDVKALTEELLEAQYNVNMMSVAKEACEHRLNSLKILTELYKGNYFSATSRGSSSHEAVIERHNDSQREMLDKHPKMMLRKKVST